MNEQTRAPLEERLNEKDEARSAKRPRMTVTDLAAHLGLAHSTVSRALAGNSRISPETRERVKRAAAELGYVANAGARTLRSGRSGIIGLVLPDIRNEFFAAVAQGLADDCIHQKRQMVLALSSDDPGVEAEVVRSLLESQVEGIVIALSAKPHRETLSLLNQVYCVQFLRHHRALSQPVVTVDAAEGSRMATEHLLSLGHRKIGFVGLPSTTMAGAERLAGFREAFRQAGVVHDADLVCIEAAGADAGYSQVAAFLRLPQPPTAIYLSAASFAPGGILALNEAGVRIPDDLSLVVTGSSPWYETWPGGLTSISLPLEEFAHAASAMILKRRHEGPRSVQPFVKLNYQLVVRGSTRAVKP